MFKMNFFHFYNLFYTPKLTFNPINLNKQRMPKMDTSHLSVL